MPIFVPNLKPTLSMPYKLAIISEYPGKSEVEKGEPFVGTSGNILQSLMTNQGLLRSACYLGNVCQVQTPTHGAKTLSPYENWTLDNLPSSHYLQQGLQTIREDLAQFQPSCILLLGNAALRAAGVHIPITSYRGSIFLCKDTSSPFFGYKCVASFNPAYVFRVFSEAPLLDFDIGRAKSEALTSTLDLPKRHIEVELTPFEVCNRLLSIQAGQTISVDIEGTPESGIKCIGISLRPDYAFVFWPGDFIGFQQVEIWHALGTVLGDAKIRKVLQNSLFDNFALSWCYGMPIRNVWWDTMLSGWEIFPELEKGLDTQTSIWTREPYYKSERKIPDKHTHSVYCGKDACVTFEIALAQEAHMSVGQKQHFHFNMSLLPALHYMELRGIKYDKKKADERLVEVLKTQAELVEKMTFVARKVNPTRTEVNPNTAAGENAMKNLLYRDLKYPPQYTKERGRRTDKLTCGVDALLTLSKDEPPDSIIRHMLLWRSLEGQRKQLVLSTDPDGRVRCTYNLVGTETGRMACYESPTGSGSNMQTIMHKFRDMYVADDRYDFFKCDLSGADGWTVAAWCNHFGDPTMLEDYMFGVGFKPAKVLMLLYLGGAMVNNRSRAELYDEMKSLETSTGWLYPACKAAQHGGCYGMKPAKMSDTIKLRSYKDTGHTVYVEPKKCKTLQELFLDTRYRGIKRWQELYVRRQLSDKRSLTCASGHVRYFFGRPQDHETFTSALSHEPQANTTYATNLALQNLWQDPSNRLAYYFDPATMQTARAEIEKVSGVDGLVYILDKGRELQDPTKSRIHASVGAKLLIEPLHQVHDELSGQWPTALRGWARSKMKSYFNNELDIAHQKITIPFEGKYGRSWGECKEEI